MGPVKELQVNLALSEQQELIWVEVELSWLI